MGKPANRKTQKKKNSGKSTCVDVCSEGSKVVGGSDSRVGTQRAGIELGSVATEARRFSSSVPGVTSKSSGMPSKAPNSGTARSAASRSPDPTALVSKAPDDPPSVPGIPSTNAGARVTVKPVPVKNRIHQNQTAIPSTMLASRHPKPSEVKTAFCPNCQPPPGYDEDNYLVDEKTGRLIAKKMAAMAPKERRKIYSDFLLNRLRGLHPALGEKLFEMVTSRKHEDILLLCYNCEALRSYAEKCILDLRNRGFFNHVQTCV